MFEEDHLVADSDGRGRRAVATTCPAPEVAAARRPVHHGGRSTRRKAQAVSQRIAIIGGGKIGARPCLAGWIQSGKQTKDLVVAEKSK